MAGKGSQYEREICRSLSLWWTEGADDDVFWRTSQSGGRATTRKKKGLAADTHSCDICAIKPIGQDFLRAFAPEIKRGYKGASIADLMDSPLIIKNIHYESWILQADEARENSGALYWMIIHRRDQREATITMPLSVFNHPANKTDEHPYIRMNKVCDQMKVRWMNRKTDTIVPIFQMRFEDFMRFVSPSYVKQDILNMEV